MIKDISDKFLEFLETNNLSMLISTYEYNQLVILNQGPKVWLTEAKRPLGIAINDKFLFLAELDGISGYRRYEKDLYTFASWHHTCLIDLHDLCIGANKLWGINTLFSSLCAFDARSNFREIWKPPFISESLPEDRCHLNGMAMWRGAPRYVSCFNSTDTKRGWKDNYCGKVIDIATNEIVLDNLHSPHSPKVYRESLYVIESGAGKLYRDGEVILELPQYPRGLAFHGDKAVVAVSGLRQEIGGHAWVYLIDLKSNKIEGYVECVDSMHEIYDIQLAPHMRVMGREDKDLQTTYVSG